jgi:ABC-type transport system substrate-binding protein
MPSGKGETMNNYWSRVLQNRSSRRRVVAASGGAMAAAGLLAACGGRSSSSGKSGSADKSGLLGKWEDTSGKAVPGGVWQDWIVGDTSTWDVNSTNQTTAVQEYLAVYETLTKAHPIPNAERRFSSTSDIVGEFADSWELAPDGQQINFKLRPNHGWDPRPPTNGRQTVAADVKASWERFAALSPFSGEVKNDTNPLGPVVSVAAPDEKTVVMKLAFPYPSIVELLGHHSYFYVMPQEAADAKFNIKGEARGSGMFFLDSVKPSVGWEMKKNPNWHANEKNRPFLDGRSVTIISEYAAGLAQFEAKNLWTFGVKDDDMLAVKGRHPELIMLDSPTRSLYGCGNIWPSQRDDSPLADVRVRRAASMVIDRDLWIENRYGVDKYRKAGIDATVEWHSHTPYGEPSWIDPRGTGLGEGAKYFKFDVAEARKLMQAAGYTKPLPLTMGTHTRGDQTDYELYASMMQESGLFQMQITPLGYDTEWREAQRSKGLGFNGFVRNACNAYNEEAYFANWFTPDGKLTAVYKPIPGITGLVLKARTEIDSNRRLDLLKQIQKEAALQMPAINNPGHSNNYTLHWPWFRNYASFFIGGGSTRQPFTEYWYDASMKS